MRAAVLESFGAPFVIKDVEERPGQGEVVVNIKASGICGRDLVIWRGGFRGLRPPLILGHEIFGELDGRSVGVFGAISCGRCRYCVSGKENLCESLIFLGEGRPGGYAERVSVPPENVFSLPDSDYVKYAAATCPLATAIHAATVAGAKRGETALVTGAGGGVGIHSIQYFRKLGLKVVSVTSEGKKDVVSRYSDEVITDARFSDHVKDVDVVFEMVGASTINESLRSLSKEGRLVLIGNVEGRSLELIRPALSIMKEHRIIGSAAFTRREYLRAVELIHTGEITPHYKTYRLDEVNEAYRDLLSSRVIGRAVLLP
ncbi:MAG: alcohol dehydrogenase catalytic domain-containing protein [Nitrososphaeria archaeon]